MTLIFDFVMGNQMREHDALVSEINRFCCYVMKSTDLGFYSGASRGPEDRTPLR